MLLFVCNRTELESIISDAQHMLDTAYEDINKNVMMPEEYENKDFPHFTLRVSIPCLPAKTKTSTDKGYDHSKEHGKKAFHFQVTKEDVPFFKFLAGHAHRLGLKNKYFGKFAKFTTTLGNNAPISDCVQFCQCIQGHLNFHLSSTSISISRIDNLDATEVIRNPANMKAIHKVSLHDMLYQLKLESGPPLFLQLSQRSTVEVNAVIPNTPEAKLMAEK